MTLQEKIHQLAQNHLLHLHHAERIFLEPAKSLLAMGLSEDEVVTELARRAAGVVEALA